MKTTEKKLQELKETAELSAKLYREYKKEYNTEHGNKGRNIIREIISLHQQGLTNKEIIAKGYNKHTVSDQVRYYTKGKRVAKTVVAQYLPKKEKK